MTRPLVLLAMRAPLQAVARLFGWFCFHAATLPQSIPALQELFFQPARASIRPNEINGLACYKKT
jgi:hypothetical protein